jgi:hypothetical protein
MEKENKVLENTKSSEEYSIFSLRCVLSPGKANGIFGALTLRASLDIMADR